MRAIVALVVCALLVSACGIRGSEEEAAAPPPVISESERLLNLLRANGLSASQTSEGLEVQLSGVSFATNSTALTPLARSRLQSLASILNEQRVATRQITIEGHTDSVGSEGYNLRLSRERAAVVGQELVFNQVQASRITTIGYGETRPIAANINPDGSPNPEGQERNRRVAIILHEVPEDL